MLIQTSFALAIDRRTFLSHFLHEICFPYRGPFWQKVFETRLLLEVSMNADDTIERPTKPRGRPKGIGAGNRLHIYIPESLTHRLLEIQRDTPASSITEVVKDALTLYAA